ncbi:hypothetical protein A6R68_01592 [Neotoma lepida]|uniref:Uncharacterized protein n=1 Tax=Neotoma lepida TaxID=56216 RepID=A0A1A6GW69_NEOLE|nr:hypothetical protein A6R68_01592 [Neotoma lepida]
MELLVKVVVLENLLVMRQELKMNELMDMNYQSKNLESVESLIQKHSYARSPIRTYGEEDVLGEENQTTPNRAYSRLGMPLTPSAIASSMQGSGPTFPSFHMPRYHHYFQQGPYAAIQGLRHSSAVMTPFV